jgi:hypothetical protein
MTTEGVTVAPRKEMMNITKKTIVGILGGATLATAALTGVAATASAEAATKARVTVTIQAQGVELSGVVKSKKASCAANRKVKVFIMVDGEPHLFASDTTDEGPAPYDWNTGNTGQEGTFFAKVSAKPGCRADVSPTITAVRPPD